MAESNRSAPTGTGRTRIRLGQVLVDEGLLTKRQLKRALREQKRLDKSLGHTLVALDYVKEEQIVAAFNRRYGAHFTGLNADFDTFLKRQGFKAKSRWYSIRIPIRVKLSLAVVFIIWGTILGLSLLVFVRQAEQLTEQAAKTGKVVLSYVANNAVLALLNDDVLALNTLVKEAGRAEGVLYAEIVDRNGVVQGHTDSAKIRRKYQPPKNRTHKTQDGPYRTFSYVTQSYESSLDVRKLADTFVQQGYSLKGFNALDQFALGVKDLLKYLGLIAKGTRVLDISTPVQYGGKALGQVHVGISQDFIVEQIIKESLFIVLMSVGLIVVGLVIALRLARGFSSPLGDLLAATQEISLGNLKYKIRRIRNDEMGDLATAFNFMSDELTKKALMQDSFGKYVGSEVLDLIMADPDNALLKGTRNNVSVLFTDVRGFTSYSEQHTPEQVVEALNVYFDIATRHIREFGGYVDKFIGDAVMGVFGVPVPTENHAEQSVRAALTMQTELAERAAATGNEMLARVGIGINTGFAVSGNIGSPDKLEYTVIGDVVNVASRLNGLAAGIAAAAGETIISVDVRKAVKIRMKLEERDRQKVKGKSEPIAIYKVVSIAEPKPPAQPEEGAAPQEQAGHA